MVQHFGTHNILKLVLFSFIFPIFNAAAITMKMAGRRSTMSNCKAKGKTV
jgi:hypothetical protein